MARARLDPLGEAHLPEPKSLAEWKSSRPIPHAKYGAPSPVGCRMETVPIPAGIDALRTEVGQLVGELQEITALIRAADHAMADCSGTRSVPPSRRRR